MLISGPSGSGKSTLVHSIIRNPRRVYGISPGRIVFCYNVYQEGYNAFAHRGDVVMVQGLPNLLMLEKLKNSKPLLVLDDLMTQLEKWPDAEKLFSVCSHHYDMSVIAIIHGLFYGRTLRNLRMHSSYLVLFRNPNDKLAIRNLATQIMPLNRLLLISAYEDATRLPHSYLLVDLHKNTEERFMLRTSIYADDGTSYCYVPK